jgi:ribosomal protein S12 methylthiotransferase accessory factor YcaO
MSDGRGAVVHDLAEARERRVKREARASETALTKQEVAVELGVKPRTIDRWIRKGMPVAFRLWGGSGAPRFHLTACLEWHESQR